MDAQRPQPGLPRISPAQRRVFGAILGLTRRHGGRPPILDEIAALLRLRKPTVHSHLARLKAASLVDWDPHTPRSLRTTTDASLLAAYGLDLPNRQSPPETRRPERGAVVWELSSQSPTSLPVLGRAAAGPFITKIDQYRDAPDVVELPPELVGSAQYAVRIEGPSMEGRRLFDGDLALVDQRQLVREDDIVAAMVEDEDTDELKANVKIFTRRDGVAWLLSANPAHPPISAEGARILGRVVAVHRRL